MDVRISNKSEISCQIFVKVLERKRHERPLLQAVARLKWHQTTVWQTTEMCSSDTLLSLTSQHPSFSIPCKHKPPPEKEDFTMSDAWWDRNSTLYNAKYSVCLNSVSQENLMHLTVRTEVRSRVTNKSVLVSFYKQYVRLIVCVNLCVYVCV